MNKKRIELSIWAIIIITILVIFFAFIIIFQTKIDMEILKTSEILKLISFYISNSEILQYVTLGIFISYIIIITQIYINKEGPIESTENEIFSFINRILVYTLPLIFIIYLNNQEILLTHIFNFISKIFYNLSSYNLDLSFLCTLIIVGYTYKLFEQKEKNWRLYLLGILFINFNIIYTIELVVIYTLWSTMNFLLNELRTIENRENILKMDFNKFDAEIKIKIPILKNYSVDFGKLLKAIFSMIESVFRKNDLYELSLLLITITLVLESIYFGTTIFLPLYLLITVPTWILIIRSIPSRNKVKILLTNNKEVKGIILKRSLKHNYIILKNNKKHEKIYYSSIISEESDEV